MAAQGDVFLLEGQLLVGGDADLPFDQIDAGHHLGHRMLDLEARIHLDEIEGAVLENELHRAGAAIIHRAHRREGGLIKLTAQLGGKTGRRGFLDHLLMPALH